MANETWTCDYGNAGGRHLAKRFVICQAKIYIINLATKKARLRSYCTRGLTFFQQIFHVAVGHDYSSARREEHVVLGHVDSAVEFAYGV